MAVCSLSYFSGPHSSYIWKVKLDQKFSDSGPRGSWDPFRGQNCLHNNIQSYFSLFIRCVVFPEATLCDVIALIITCRVYYCYFKNFPVLIYLKVSIYPSQTKVLIICNCEGVLRPNVWEPLNQISRRSWRTFIHSTNNWSFCSQIFFRYGGQGDDKGMVPVLMEFTFGSVDKWIY